MWCLPDMAKRFYKDVSVSAKDDGFVVQLDGRTLKTPGKKILVLPSERIAKVVAAEWEVQGDEIVPTTMPCTRLCNVAVERDGESRDELINEARAYAGTDLLCYRRNDPEAFAKRQTEQWNPVLEWATKQGIDLKTTDSLIAISQDEAALDAVATYANSLNDLRLTLLVHFISVFGSAILGIAVMKRHLTGAQAFKLSRLAEDWQIEQWGEDEEAKAVADALAAEVDALCELIGS